MYYTYDNVIVLTANIYAKKAPVSMHLKFSEKIKLLKRNEFTASQSHNSFKVKN